MGNIFRDRLEDVFASDYAAQWTNKVPALCTDCRRWSRCLGGCRAASEQMGLSLAEVDPALGICGRE